MFRDCNIRKKISHKAPSTILQQTTKSILAVVSKMQIRLDISRESSAGDSHEMSYQIIFRKVGKVLQKGYVH